MEDPAMRAPRFSAVPEGVVPSVLWRQCECSIWKRDPLKVSMRTHGFDHNMKKGVLVHCAKFDEIAQQH